MREKLETLSLIQLKELAKSRGIKGISTIRFTNEDIVRHPLVTKIVKAFDGK